MINDKTHVHDDLEDTSLEAESARTAARRHDFAGLKALGRVDTRFFYTIDCKYQLKVKRESE